MLHVDGQKDAAIQAYTALIELSARYRTLTRFRSAVYQDLRQWDAAINDLTLALDVFRVSPIDLFVLIQIMSLHLIKFLHYFVLFFQLLREI